MGGRASQCVVGFSKLEHSTYACTLRNRLSISQSFHWFKLGYTVQLRNYRSVVFIVLKNAIQSLTVATTQWEILKKSCIALVFMFVLADAAIDHTFMSHLSALHIVPTFINNNSNPAILVGLLSLSHHFDQQKMMKPISSICSCTKMRRVVCPLCRGTRPDLIYIPSWDYTVELAGDKDLLDDCSTDLK